MPLESVTELTVAPAAEVFPSATMIASPAAVAVETVIVWVAAVPGGAARRDAETGPGRQVLVQVLILGAVVDCTAPRGWLFGPAGRGQPGGA